MANTLNIVLVHGAWADGSSWNKVIPVLKEAGHTVVAVQNNLTSLADDVETTRRLAESLEGPTLLVGHSYGGAVITEAAHLCPNVIGLIYIAAFGPEVGESLSSLGASAPEPPPGAVAVRPNKYGFLWLDRELMPANFCQDVNKTEAETMASTQRPVAIKCFDDKITDAGWKNLPTWYQISENDRMIPPPAQHFMAARMKAKTLSLSTSHTPMVSQPHEIALFILHAAKDVVVAPVAETTVN